MAMGSLQTTVLNKNRSWHFQILIPIYYICFRCLDCMHIIIYCVFASHHKCHHPNECWPTYWYTNTTRQLSGSIPAQKWKAGVMQACAALRGRRWRLVAHASVLTMAPPRATFLAVLSAISAACASSDIIFDLSGTVPVLCVVVKMIFPSCVP